MPFFSHGFLIDLSRMMAACWSCTNWYLLPTLASKPCGRPSSSCHSPCRQTQASRCLATMTTSVARRHPELPRRIQSGLPATVVYSGPHCGDGHRSARAAVVSSVGVVDASFVISAVSLRHLAHGSWLRQGSRSSGAAASASGSRSWLTKTGLRYQCQTAVSSRHWELLPYKWRTGRFPRTAKTLVPPDAATDSS